MRKEDSRSPFVHCEGVSRPVVPSPRLFQRSACARSSSRAWPAPLVMGILNVTPDSFAERGPRLDAGAAIRGGARRWNSTARIWSISAASRRGPVPTPLSKEEELARVLPIVRGLAGRLRIPMSIDTYKADVARAALDAGACIVNDVSGLRREPALARVVGQYRAALVLMHSRGTPATMTEQRRVRGGGRRGGRRIVGECRPCGRRQACRRAGSWSTPAWGLPNGLRTAMVCWQDCLKSRRRLGGRCWSALLVNRSCARR